MISIYKIKPKFQQLLRPILKLLRKIGVTPNSITIFSILFSFLLSNFYFGTKLKMNNNSYYLIVNSRTIFRMMLNVRWNDG